MTTATIENVFQALSDPTRRGVVERLSAGPASVSELARPFDMALPSFVQHLGVLETAGLVRSRKHGRVRTYELAREGLNPVEDWLSRTRRIWETRLDQLDRYLIGLKNQEGNPP